MNHLCSNEANEMTKEQRGMLLHDHLFIADPAAVSDIAAIEARLGFTLPPLLREVYARTSLRKSEMLHLLEPNLSEDGKYLIIGDDQQGACFYAIALADLGSSMPIIATNMLGPWAPEAYDAAQFLDAFWILSRAYEAPCEQVVLGKTELTRLGMVPTTLASGLDADMYINVERGLVYCNSGEMLGARTEEALTAALAEVDQEM
jgi:hypothetical protein